MPASSTQLNTQAVLLWGAVLIGAVAFLGAAVWGIRRWALTKPGAARDDLWSLQNLRDLKAAGQLSEKEFESLKARTLQSLAPDSPRKSGASKTGGENRPDDEGIKSR